MHSSRLPRHTSGRVVADRGVSGRHAATSKSSIAWTNAARSMGARAVTILPSFMSRSGLDEHHMGDEEAEKDWQQDLDRLLHAAQVEVETGGGQAVGAEPYPGKKGYQ